METVKAKVSSRILSKADRLFSNTFGDIVIELVQNARRAGATQVSFQLDESGVGTKVQVTDNGSGVLDFSKLLALGDSDWDPEMETKEDPAGMGFFSLIHSGVLVESFDKRAYFSKEVFLGKEEARIYDGNDPVEGTRLTFVRSQGVNELRLAIENNTRYAKLPVFVNGDAVDQRDFLAGAKYIEEKNGVRIGVFTSYHRDTLNFHGKTIYDSQAVQVKNALLAEGRYSSKLSLYAYFDVLETSAVRLKLPDRSGVVRDDLYKALMEEAVAVMYRYVATLPQHVLPYEDFQKAQALGITLQEAVPYLELFRSSPRESNCEVTSYLYRDSEGNLSDVVSNDDLSKAALVDTAGNCLDTALSIIAEYYPEKIPVVLYQQNPSFQGYSWYNAIPTLTDPVFRTNKFKVEEFGGYSSDELFEIVPSIELSFNLVMRNPDLLDQTHAVHVPILVFYDEEAGQGIDACRVILASDSPWVTEKSDGAGPFYLSNAISHIGFEHIDDGDTWETQENEFDTEVEKLIARFLGGQLAAIRLAMSNAVAEWELRSAFQGYEPVSFVVEWNGKALTYKDMAPAQVA